MGISESEDRRCSDRLSTLNDDELVRIAKLQLPYVTSAYEVLFHRYHQKLMLVCYRYLKSAEEAEETVNDTLLIVFNKLAQFEQRSSFKTWLYKIAHNQALSKLRKNQLEMLEYEDTYLALDTDEQKDKQIEEAKNKQINSLLDRLSLEERSIVVFRMAGNLEFSEIAQVVDEKLSTVKMRYKRALEKMALSVNSAEQEN